MAEHPSQGPPSWPLRFLRLILRPDFVEEIEGDMEELFQEHLEHRSPARARRTYAWEVLRLIRPSLLRPLLRIPYQPIMLKNHLLVAFRVFAREKLYTLVNIIGMSMGMTLALLILGYVQYELSYENLNPNSDRLVRITMDYLDGETVVDQDCETYPPLGPMCKRVIPEVEDYVRTYGIDERPIRVGDKYFSEPMIYAADSSFFRLFNYPLLFGSEEGIFRQPFEVVLTQSMARKFFGKTDVVGEEMFFIGADPAFIVRGVVPDAPPNTHLKFNILISYRTMEVAFGESNDNWGGNNTFTYLLIHRADQYPAFEKSLEELNVKLVTEEKIENEQVIAQPIKEIHLYSNKSFEPEINGDARSVFFLFGVGILVIVIAIVNYINLSTSKSLDRAQEVGIRKVLGSSMTQLRSQFFMEALLINVLSAGLAVGLIALAWPAFQQMADLPKAYQLGSNANFWLALVGLIAISTLLSGIFPAFILSSFEPISVLKGRFAHSGRGLLLRKVLVIFQFGITIFLLAQTLTANRQLQFLRDIDLGVDIEQTVVVRAPQGDALEKRYSVFRDQLLNYPDFEHVSLSNCVPGMPSHQLSTTTGIQLVGATEEHNYNFYLYFHDAAFLSTMKMTLLAGDNFIANAGNELQVMINEEAMRLWGIPTPEEAIGKQLDYWGDKRTIIGVIKNFHQAGAKSDFIPMIFMYSGKNGDLASIRTRPGNIFEQLDKLEEVYRSTFPNGPFDYFFMDQEYEKQYRSDERFREVFTYLTGFAILIACIGLFGLVSFTVAKRAREIGIRKVLGAEVSSIITLLAREFIWLIVIASAVALPLTYVLLGNWLEQFANHIDLHWWLLVLPAVLVITVAGLTILSQTYQIATTTPIKSLREE